MPLIKIQLKMNERVFYLPFNALLGYNGTAKTKRMKWRMIVLSDIGWTHTSQWSNVSRC